MQPSLTAGEERKAALLKRAITTSPDKGIIQLPTFLRQQSPSTGGSCYSTGKFNPLGLGFLGEQGAESIHAKFTLLGLA